MEERAACLVAISDRRLSKCHVSQKTVQVVVLHKFEHLGVVVNLIIRQDNRMHRHCPIEINALTKVHCNARPAGTNRMLYIQCRACFGKHLAIARPRVQCLRPQGDFALAPGDPCELGLRIVRPRGVRLRRYRIDLYTPRPAQLMLQILQLTVKICGLVLVKCNLF